MPMVPPRVTMLRPRWQPTRDGWTVVTDRVPVPGTAETAEPDGRKPARVVEAAEGLTVDGPTTSADGSAIAWVLLSEQDGQLKSQLLVRPTVGTVADVALTDGAALDLMPSFAPGGRRVLFASDRAGPNRFGVYDVTIDPPGLPTPVVAAAATPRGRRRRAAAATDLWPTLDTSPSPQLYVEARPARRPVPPADGGQPDDRGTTDLGHVGAQPRVSPRADAVVFVRADPGTGQTGPILASARPGRRGAGELTNTPDADEWDPAWSKTGSRIAFASDRPSTAARAGAVRVRPDAGREHLGAPRRQAGRGRAGDGERRLGRRPELVRRGRRDLLPLHPRRGVVRMGGRAPGARRAAVGTPGRQGMYLAAG
jgi:hypothetical protein